jgi:hypothetical protein
VSYSGETLESPMWSVRVIPIDCRGTGECRKVGDHPRGPLSLGGTPVALNGRLQMFTDDPLSGVAYAVTTRARSAVGVTARLLLTCWRRELSIVTDSLPTAGFGGTRSTPAQRLPVGSRCYVDLSRRRVVAAKVEVRLNVVLASRAMRNMAR